MQNCLVIIFLENLISLTEFKNIFGNKFAIISGWSVALLHSSPGFLHQLIQFQRERFPCADASADQPLEACAVTPAQISNFDYTICRCVFLKKQHMYCRPRKDYIHIHISSVFFARLQLSYDNRVSREIDFACVSDSYDAKAPNTIT